MAAPDFYFAINATFKWICDNWGEEGLHRYWEAMGREQYADVTRRFAAGGLAAAADYWREFYAQEPGAEVTVTTEPTRVLVEVHVCPAIAHLRAHGREIMPLYCEHCRVVSAAMCDGAAMAVEVEGGMGNCRQSFSLREGASPEVTA